MSVRRAIKSMPEDEQNPFLTQPIGRVSLSNAIPMAVVVSTGGLLNVVDGIFVGRFVGADALAAISLAFPIVMVLTALTALVGGGMASLFTRHLGAQTERRLARSLLVRTGLLLPSVLDWPDPPPLKWSFATFSKMEETHGRHATKA